MDRLHATLSALRTETKAVKDDPVNVFREFLAQLDEIQRRVPPVKAPRAKPQQRLKPARRGQG
jgi:hypothetical protein